MSEQERIVITECRHQKLAKQIEESPLNNPVREVLLLKLKVASSAGYAAVLREFEEEMELYRAKHLPSYRPKLFAKRAILQFRPAAPAAIVRPIPAPPESLRRGVVPVKRKMLRRSWSKILRLCHRGVSDRQTDFLSLLSLSFSPARTPTRRAKSAPTLQRT